MLRTVLFGVLPGMAGGLLLVGLLGRRWLGVAMAIGVFSAYVLVKAVPPWPVELYLGDGNGLHWLLWFVTGAGLIALVGGMKPLPLALSLPLAAVWFGAQTWFLLGRLRLRWAMTESVVQHAAAFLLLVAVWALLRRVLVRQHGIGVGIVWTVCLLADSVVLLLGRSALQGQLAAGAAAAFGAAVGTALWRRPFAIGPATALPFVTTHVGLLLAGYHFSFLPAGAVLCAAVAPGGLLLAVRSPEAAQRPWRFTLGLLATGLAIALSIVLAQVAEF